MQRNEINYIKTTSEDILRYKIFIAKLINSTTKTLGNTTKPKNNYQAALLGISLRDNLTLYSISNLAESKYNGDAILDLSRKLIEDMIGIEFMLLKGAEETAKQFFDYIHVEQKITDDFLDSAGVKINDKLHKQTMHNFEQVKSKFIFRKDEIARSWAKCNLEQMVEELIGANRIDADDKNFILTCYVYGNRKNHLSPIDVYTFSKQEIRDLTQIQNTSMGLIVAIVCYLRIITHFLEKFHEKHLAANLNKEWEEINSQSKQ